MAFDSTKFFTVLGKVVKNVNVLNGLQSTLDTVWGDIEDIHEAQSTTHLWEGQVAVLNAAKSALSTTTVSAAGFANTLLQDEDLVSSELPVSDFGVTSLVAALIEWMNDNTETVAASVGTATGSAKNTQAGANAGQGYYTSTLDGTSLPGIFSSPAHRDYVDVASQFMTNDTLYARCTSASAAGSEVWQLHSTKFQTFPYQPTDEAVGNGQTMITANNAANALSVSNGDFETFTVADTPDNWTMTGTVTTDYQEENTVVFAGTSSLKINTSGTVLEQQLSNVVKNRRYCVAIQVARPSGDPGTSELDVVVDVENSAGTTVYSTTTHTVEQAAAPGTFIPILSYFSVNAGEDVSDVYLKITVNNFVLSPTAVFLDEILVVPPVYYGGIGRVILRGTDNFEVGDYLSVNTTNDNAGVFQTFARRFWYAQLPTSGSPTHADSLAT